MTAPDFEVRVTSEHAMTPPEFGNGSMPEGPMAAPGFENRNPGQNDMLPPDSDQGSRLDKGMMLLH